jgi:predicted small lipoprotein YifL
MSRCVWAAARALAACAELVLAGCGQKGPLYLPEKGGTVVTAPTEAPAPPAPQPQSTPGPPPEAPASSPPPPKKSDTDEDQNPK